MSKSRKLRAWLPVIWVVLATIILAVDYFTGPLISCSMLFVIPVALASRTSGRWLGIGLGALMPISHFGFTFLWKTPWSITDSMINAGVRIAVLVAFAVLIDRTTRQAGEIR